MRKLFILRHGKYNNDLPGYPLTQVGREQMKTLASKIKERIGASGSILVLSSTARRALQSSEILCDALSIKKFEPHDALWYEKSLHHYLAQTLELLDTKRDDAEIIILVTHIEHTTVFPKYFSEQEPGKTPFPPTGIIIENGEGWEIDCENWRMLPIK